MNLNTFKIATVAIFALTGALGCGGGGGTQGGGSGGSLTSAQRIAAMDAVNAYYAGLPHTDTESDNQAIAAFMRTRSEFEASGVSEDSTVWGRFKGGRLFAFVNNRPPSPGANHAVEGASPATAVPTSRKAYALHAMGPGYDNGTADIAGMLLTKGYNVTAGSCSIAVLKGVDEAGVFYIDTHGGSVSSKDGKKVGVLGTSELVDVETDAAYQEDLDAGRLVYMSEPWAVDETGRSVYQKHYAFTPDFVKTYMNLGPNSLVYVDACSSFETTMIAAAGSKGASVFLGWDGKVADAHAARASRFFFDRTLGTNLLNPRLDPPQRPFDVASVYNELVYRQWTVSIGELCYTSVGEVSDPNLLTPTIMRLAPDETTDTLHIAGLFGQDPGADGVVMIGNTQLHVKSWTNEDIACDLPAQGEGSAGDVVVSVRGHRSNVVQLTEWWPTFKFTYHGLGTMEYSMTIIAHIRCDVHSFRMAMEEQPRQGEWPFLLAKGSTASIAADGSYADPSGALYVLSINGASNVPLNGDPARTFEGMGRIHTDVVGGVRTMYVGLNGVVTDGLRTVVTIPGVGGYTSFDEIRFNTADFTDNNFSEVPIALDDAYGLVQGSVTAGRLTFEWDGAPAVFPPSPGAERIRGK